MQYNSAYILMGMGCSSRRCFIFRQSYDLGEADNFIAELDIGFAKPEASRPSGARTAGCSSCVILRQEAIWG